MASVMKDMVVLGLLIVLHCEILVFQELCRQLSTLTETQTSLFTVFSGLSLLPAVGLSYGE